MVMDESPWIVILRFHKANARRGTEEGAGPRGAALGLFVFALVLAAAPALAADSSADRPAYWGTPSVDGGKCCQTLAEVRDNIDRLDRQIIASMAERGKYVAEAGRFKKDPGAVSAPARVEAIIERVRGIASQDGLAPDVAEKSYRAMIAAFEDYERSEWVKRHPEGQ
jgi:isochorismate pyruvate lyase